MEPHVTDPHRADRLACFALVLLGLVVTALVTVTSLNVDGSAVAPALIVVGAVGLYRLRPTRHGHAVRIARHRVGAAR